VSKSQFASQLHVKAAVSRPRHKTDEICPVAAPTAAVWLRQAWRGLGRAHRRRACRCSSPVLLAQQVTRNDGSYSSDLANEEDDGSNNFLDGSTQTILLCGLVWGWFAGFSGLQPIREQPYQELNPNIPYTCHAH